MRLIHKKGFSQNRFKSCTAAQRPCRQRGSHYEAFEISIPDIKMKIRNKQWN